MDPAGFEPAASTLRTSNRALKGGEIEIGDISEDSTEEKPIEKNLSREKPLNLAQIIKKHVVKDEKRFMEYLTGKERFQRGMVEKRATTYFTALKNLPEIAEPRELINANLKETPVLAVRALFDYLQTYTDIRSIAGYSFEEWRKFLIVPKREKVKKVPRIPRETVNAAYEAIQDDLKTFYKILLYTGLRGEHAHKLYMLKKKAGKPMRFTKEEIYKFPSIPAVAYIDSSPAAARGKDTDIAVFPASFIPELLGYTYPGYTIDHIRRKFSAAGQTTKTDFTGKHLRKFHAQLLMKNRVDRLIIDYLQGRQPRGSTVLLDHYASPDEEATRQYAEVLNSSETFPTL